VQGLVAAIAIEQDPPRMSSPESNDIAIHNVEKGDTLWNISKRYTGTGFNYPHVAKENEITNPDLIFIR
jgi:nucleoid-associated protein YgaU